MIKTCKNNKPLYSSRDNYMTLSAMVMFTIYAQNNITLENNNYPAAQCCLNTSEQMQVCRTGHHFCFVLLRNYLNLLGFSIYCSVEQYICGTVLWDLTVTLICMFVYTGIVGHCLSIMVNGYKFTSCEIVPVCFFNDGCHQWFLPGMAKTCQLCLM